MLAKSHRHFGGMSESGQRRLFAIADRVWVRFALPTVRALSILAVVWALFSGQAQAQMQFSSDDIAVIRALLLPSCKVEPANYIVLSFETTAPINHGQIVDKKGNPDRSALINLLERNKTSAELPKELACPGIKFMTPTAISVIQKAPTPSVGVRGEGTGGSGTLVRISVPGFSAKLDKAVIFVHVLCGPLCGDQSYVQFKLEAGTWIRESYYTVARH